MLASAVSAPLATFDGHFLHQSIFGMAAAYLISLSKNHPFNDGNKRTAISATTTFLQMNNIALDVSEDELVEFVVRVASEKVTNQEVADFLESYSSQVELEI